MTIYTRGERVFASCRPRFINYTGSASRGSFHNYNNNIIIIVPRACRDNLLKIRANSPFLTKRVRIQCVLYIPATQVFCVGLKNYKNYMCVFFIDASRATSC